MNLVKSPKSMVSTTNVSENMEMQMFGNISPIYLTFYPLPRSSRIKFSVCMEDCHRVSIRWIISARSIGFRKYPMKDQCATSSGPTRMIVVVGGFLREVRGIRLVRIFQKLSIIIMVSL